MNNNWFIRFNLVIISILFLFSTARAEQNIFGPIGSGSFGTSVTVLPNGNFVVTDPYFTLPGSNATHVGAVYFYSPGGNLISRLTGSSSYDEVGSGITVLTNGNFVVFSERWNGGRGAATWGNAETGIVGVVSTANSLVGSTENDFFGTRVVPLSNGNYAVV